MTDPNLRKYLVADLFCGAGGSSTGAKRAIEEAGGTMELVAINHWSIAIATHAANHPTARHMVEDVSLADPETIVPEGRLDLLMASPECRFYSRARGGKPVHDQGRMNPWAVHRWLTSLDVQRVLVENVPEFTDWGPLGQDGRPERARKGQHFQAWFLTFHSLGYHAEWRMLNAADYGDATTRIRFFLQARNDGEPIRWPEATHSKTGGPSLLGTLPKWRPAREIIDWTNPGRSLLDDPKYRKKPLSEKTRRRIARGLERFGGPLAPLYIRLLDLPEHMAAEGEEEGQEAAPFILNRGGENGGNRAHSIDQPTPTATCRGAGYLVEPQASPFHGPDRQHTAPRNMDEPVHTITTLTAGGEYIVRPEVQPMTGATRNENTPKDPEGTVPAAVFADRDVDRNADRPTGQDTQPFLLGQQSQGAPRGVDDPPPTVAASGAISLVQTLATACQTHGRARGQDGNQRDWEKEDEGKKEKRPAPAPTSPAIIEVNHGKSGKGNQDGPRRAQTVDDPLGVITTKRGMALVTHLLAQTDQQPEPAAGYGERAVLEQALNPKTDPRRVVHIDGQPYVLDIRFRMLQNGELARAMGFEGEETAYEFVGNASEVTRQIGNAVPVNLAAALVRAALEQS